MPLVPRPPPIVPRAPPLAPLSSHLAPLESIPLLKKSSPRLRILIFTSDRSPKTIHAAFMAGADGFILKTEPRQKLTAAIHLVHAGGNPLSVAIADELVHFFQRRRELLPLFSPMESNIIRLLDQGHTYKDTASLLQLTIATLREHCRRAVQKMGAHSLAEATWLRRHVV